MNQIKIILTFTLFLLTNLCYSQIYDLPSFMNEITQLYATDRDDVVKVKLENAGFKLLESEPDYILENITHKSNYTYYAYQGDYVGRIYFWTKIENDKIEYTVWFDFDCVFAEKAVANCKKYFLEKPNHSIEKDYYHNHPYMGEGRESWIWDTTWIWGRSDNHDMSVHPLYLRIDNGFFEKNKINADFYITRFINPLPDHDKIKVKKNFDQNSVVNIPLKKLGKSYFIKVYLGGVGYDFLFDTGASDFLINKKMENDLLNTGIIRRSHYIDSETYEIANGSTFTMRRVKIAKLKIGAIYLENIVAGISENGAQPLFGISALNQFQTWKINNKTNILTIKK